MWYSVVERAPMYIEIYGFCFLALLEFEGNDREA